MENIIGKSQAMIVSQSPAMQKVMEQINRIAPSQLSILFYGENGTGKNLLARYTHDLSPRKDAPFVIMDCARMNPNLVESELFGHEKGAFTGAMAKKIGLFEEANGGTLFLNEVQNLSLEIQAKLLEVLDSHIFRRVGGTQDLQVAFRLISATNMDIPQLTRTGRCREDLYFRITEANIFIPPLRERREDILPLAVHIVEKFNPEEGKNVKLTQATEQLLLAHAWPGNVRELEKMIHQAVVLCEGPELLRAHFPLNLLLAAQHGQAKQEQWRLERWQREYITAILEASNFSLPKASKILGISYNTLKRKVEKYGLMSGQSDISKMAK